MKTRQLLFLTISVLFFAIFETNGQTPNPANGAYWGLTGNSGTSHLTNFIGTTDGKPLVFKVDNIFSGYLSSNRTSFGYNSIPFSSGAIKTVAFGAFTLTNSTGGANSAFGNYALNSNTIGGYNTAIGNEAMKNNMYSSLNVAVGDFALYNNIGDALNSNTFGCQNVALGARSLFDNTTGYANVGIGYYALAGNIGGYNNVAIGKNSMRLVDGNNNIGIGAASGSLLVSGDYNIFIGNNAGDHIQSGNGNIIFGLNQTPYITLDNTIIMNTGSGSERFRIDSNGNMGLGTSTPNARLEVKGSSNQSGLRFTNLKSDSPALANTLAPINSKFLTVDLDGDVVLQNLPAPSVNPANGSYWGLTGNSGINPTVNFIGTTTNMDLVFRRNNFRSGLIGTTNTSFGLQAIENNTGSNNSAFGVNSLKSNSTGQHNTSVGASSMISNVNGSNNSSFGHESLGANTDGQQNSAFGARAMGSNISGDNNSALGFGALAANDSNNNSAIGWYALRFSLGSGNIGIGSESGRAFVSGDNNIFLGNFSGSTGFTNGNSNIFIGYNTSLPNGVSNSLTIGNVITGTGMGSISDGKIGIGLNGTTPNNRLEIRHGADGSSGLRFTNLKSSNNGLPNTALPINNKFLTVNADGDVVLQNLPAGSSGTVSIANGTNTTVTGTGVSPTPYVINAKNIYTDNGSLTGTRTVTMGNNNLIFSSNGSTTGNGRVYIGDTALFPAITATSNYRLLVEGGILTEKVKVALRSTANWADYVFASDYKLRPLKEVETFIKENKHLPGIESAETLSKEGLDLADMQAKQMEKIEELTLYAIEQNKQIEKQNKEIEELKVLVKTLLEKK